MANRSKIMGLHGLKNKTHKNAFDLSYRNLMTGKVGELLPCFVQELNPGDSIKVSTSYFTRTAPLQSAAFTRLRENVQFFFVPYSQLWKYFPSQVINMTKNAAGGDVSRVASGILENMKVTTQMPVVNYTSLHKYLFSMINSTPPKNNEGDLFNHGCYRHAETAKLLQLLGYGNFNEQFAEFNANIESDNEKFIEPSYTSSPYLSPFRLLAYQKICNDHYTYRQWQPYNASLCNIDYLVPSSSNYLDMSSMVESLRKDQASKDSMNFLDMRFSNLPLDYFNGVLPTSQFGDESVVSLNLDSSSQVFRTVEGLGKDSATLELPNLHVYNPTGTPQLVLTTTASENISNHLGISTGNPKVLVSSSGDSVLSQISTKNQSVLTDVDLYYTDKTFSSVNGGNMSIIALRNAIAAQRYKEIQLANDVDFASQVYAHFGIKPHKDDSTSLFIGGNSSMIDINPVVNSALTADSASAVTQASPTGNGSANIKFTSDTYGVVIGIYRCTPVLDYEHVGIDRTLFKSDASDFVIPELDSIGMQQTFKCEVLAPSLPKKDSDPLGMKDYDMSLTYGYAPRYAEYKSAYDRFNGAFCNSLRSWVTGFNLKRLNQYYAYPSTWITAPNMFTCRPDIVKDIFGITQYNTSDDDQLYIGLVNMCTAVRGLSQYGLPYSN